MYECETFSSDTISSSQWNDLTEFVDQQRLTWPTHPAIDNMGEQRDSGLLYNIKHNKRWNSYDGEISVVRHQNKIIAISAVERTDIHPQLCIGGIRCWIDAGHRTKNVASKYLLDSNLNWAKNNKMWAMMLTFNEYNKSLYSAIVRKINKKTVGLANTWSNWWNDCIVVIHPIEIRYTQQWCVLKPIHHKETNKILEILYQK